MKRIVIVLLLLAAAGMLFAADSKKPLTFVWLPNDSVPESKEFRAAVDKVIADATGREVVDKLSTDYNIAIEAMATDNAAFACFGAVQYIQSHDKNSNIVPLVTNSGKSGTMSDAIYYSRICVRTADAAKYKSGQGYAMDKIQGKRFAFVSNSSTSGFLFPSSGIVGHFSKKAKWAKLNANDLIEGGADRFFNQVVFGGSHQGSLAALLMGKVDAAAFDDLDVVPYVTLKSGAENTPGAVYEIKKDASEPFDTLIGKTFTVIWAVQVVNGPICANLNLISAEERNKIVTAMTSDATAQNASIFMPADYKGPNKIIYKQTGKVRFVAIDDSLYQPIREKIR